MLRPLVLLLVLLNGAYAAWSTGWLQSWGYGPRAPNEPQRVAQQIHPEAIHLLSAQELRQLTQAARPSGKASECLRAGLFDAAQAERLREALSTGRWPADAWVLEPGSLPARWIVYLGKFPSTDMLGKKRSELLALNLKPVPLNNPALQPGLSLGGYESKEAAQTALQALATRGVRSAKVVQERPAEEGQWLRLNAVDDTQRPWLADLKPLLGNETWRSCP